MKKKKRILLLICQHSMKITFQSPQSFIGTQPHTSFGYHPLLLLPYRDRAELLRHSWCGPHSVKCLQWPCTERICWTILLHIILNLLRFYYVVLKITGISLFFIKDLTMNHETMMPNLKFLRLMWCALCKQKTSLDTLDTGSIYHNKLCKMSPRSVPVPAHNAENPS